jgi:hypothetical protein
LIDFWCLTPLSAIFQLCHGRSWSTRREPPTMGLTHLNCLAIWQQFHNIHLNSVHFALFCIVTVRRFFKVSLFWSHYQFYFYLIWLKRSCETLSSICFLVVLCQHLYTFTFQSSTLNALGQLNPHLAGMFTERSSTKFMLTFFFQSQSTTETGDHKYGTFIFQPILISFILYVTYKIVSMLYSNRYCISYRFRDIKGSRWGKLPIFWNFILSPILKCFFFRFLMKFHYHVSQTHLNYI